MSFKDYAASDAVNFSTLKYIEHSPLRYKWALDNPRPDTTGLLKGRGTHTAVLEPERFMLDYACFRPEPGKDKAIRRGKRWDAFKEMHVEDNILKEDEYRHCIQAGEAVRNHPLVAPILARSKREQSIEWTDTETGLRCKARLDLLAPDGIWDLKGVRSIELRQLSAEVARMRYHCQLAMQQEGVKRALGLTLPVGLVCVEHAPPHEVSVNDAGGEDAIYMGWTLVREWLNKVAECRASGKWPGRYSEPQTLSLPSWAGWNDDDQILSAVVINDGEEEAA